MRVMLLTGSGFRVQATALASGLREGGVNATVIAVIQGGRSGWLSISVEEGQGDFSVTVGGVLSRWVFGQPRLLARILWKRLSPHLQGVSLVHTLGLHPLGPVGLRLAMRSGSATVVQPAVSELLRSPKPPENLTVLKAADGVIVDSEALRPHCEPDVKVEVVAPLLAAEGLTFRPRPMGSSLYVLMAGRWDEEHPVVARPKLAMKALAQAEQQLGRPVILGFIGDGTRLTELKKYAAGLQLHTQFFGALEGEALIRELQKADLFLHATDIATFPEHLLKAQRCGVPAVASEVLGMRDFLPDDGSGLLAENRLSLWTEAIQRACTTDFDRGSIANGSRERFRPEASEQAMTDLYRSLVSVRTV